jgi:hypothetical protein
MKVISALCLFLFPFAVTSAAPVPYSGKVAINGVNFDGDARFTFALRDANGVAHWRNADANSSINVPVDRGNYIIFLGGQGMNPFPSNLFLDHPELYLQVRFYQADTQEWVHMLPDQRITSAPHALAAEVANLANVAKAVEPGAITKSMLAAEVLADLNDTVVIPQQDTSIQTGSITRDMLSSGVRSDLNRTIVITREMLPADVLADLNQTVDNAAIASNANIAFSKLAINKSDIIGLGIPAADTDTNLSEAAVDSMVANNGFLTAGSITRQMLPGDVLDDLNATITRSRLAVDVLADLNRAIQLSDLAPDVRADLNATITRSRLAADVLADLNQTITAGSVTRDMLASDVRADLNASLSSASVTAANMHPDLVKYFLPEISNHPAGVSVLQGTGTTLSSAATGKFLTYQWQKNGVDLSGETNATLVLTDANAANDGNYTVLVSNDWGSVTSNVSTFTVATNAPVITLVGTVSVTHEAATSYTDAGATAVDALDGNLTASIVVAGHDFNNSAIGDHNITFNVSDAGGNAAAEKVRTVTMVDTTAPVITLVGDANTSHPITTAWNDPGATAIDTRDGNLSSQVAVSGTVDVNATGANVLTYNVSDAAGNAATSVTRTVNVVQPPSGPWNFTNAVVTGRTGPTQAQVNTAYAGGSLEGKVTIATQGIQQWTVPATGTYRVEAWGAKGGGENGGKGARIIGDLALSAGSVVRVLVGQRGEQTAQGSGAGFGAGGGGGTFVYLSQNQPLIIAGGGGGQAQGGNGGQGSATGADINSTGGTGNGAGGSNGGGGAGGQNVGSFSTGGGGAGLSSNGANGLDLRNPEGKGGESPTNGGKGGEFTHQTSSYASGNAGDGGFGGGGGMSDNSGAGGGGGGYNGGGGGNNYASNWGAGGGGGSYNAGTNQSNTAGANAGQGKVTITWVGN